ncbi:MAG: hypothetical protein JWR60_2070 [Polaromonas sp.]|nr:hypothetical protein [Polaromonas sp.]
MAPTLPASRGSLPPEGAAAPAVWQSQSHGPGWKERPPRSLTARSFLPPEGAAAPAARQSQSRGPGWRGSGAPTLVASLTAFLLKRAGLVLEACTALQLPERYHGALLQQPQTGSMNAIEFIAAYASAACARATFNTQPGKFPAAPYFFFPRWGKVGMVASPESGCSPPDLDGICKSGDGALLPRHDGLPTARETAAATLLAF